MSSTKRMTQGSEVKAILAFGLPLLFGNVLQQLYNFVDTLIVGRGISMNALAAVGTTGSINFLVLGFIMGMAQGVNILVSQYFGAKDFKNLKKSVTMSLLINVFTGIIISILSIAFVPLLLENMNTPAEILEDAILYIRIIFAGILISLAYNFLSGILRALGDSKNPLRAMVIAFFVNTALDLFFVLVLGWGVAGAALATVLAQGVSALFCFMQCSKLQILHLNKEDWQMDTGLLKKSLSLSLPVAIMNSITATGVIVLQAAINAYGAAYVAAYSAASKINMILEQISSTFGYATGTFVGQNIGANEIERIKKGVARINLVVIGFNVATALLIICFAKPLMAFMVGEDETLVMEYGAHCLIFLSVFLFALGILWVHRCALQSMSDTFFPMLSGLLEFFARVLGVMLFPGLMGFDGLLMAEVFAWICAAIMLVIVYKVRIHLLLSKQLAASSI